MKNIASEEENTSIHTRLPDLDGAIHGKPARLLEAHLHAIVDVLPRRPLKTANDDFEARPSGRVVPAGTAMHVPGAYTTFGRQRHTLGPVATTDPSTRRKPAFRRPSEAGHNLYERYLQSSKGTSTQHTVGERNRPFRPAFRKAYSSLASPVASTSKIRIEDMDDMGLQDPKADTLQFPSPKIAVETNSPFPAPNHPQDGNNQTHIASSAGEKAEGAGLISEVDGLQGVRLIEPKSRAHMVGILRQAVRMLNSPKLSTLTSLYSWHNRYPELQSTGSFNILLQLAYDIRHLRAFNQILTQDMPAAGVKRDNITYDLEMESYARHGHWKQVVACWTARQKEGVPLNAIGWTRLAQAVTKQGTTSLNREDIGTTMSPIYRALYDLPKGVRQMQLHRLSVAQRMDVDQMLALMMPDDLQPLDFHATLVIAHRLAKQLRWREAEDVVALYLDRSAESWELEGRASQSNAELQGTSGASKSAGQADESQNWELGRAQARREQSALALLHVLLECLVISRSSPSMIEAYIDNYIVRYENTGVTPKYHTIFFVLSAYRVRPLAGQFKEAYEKFVSLETIYHPTSHNLTDRYGLSRCLRQLQNYSHMSLRQLQKQGASDQALSGCRADLASINSRIAELGSLDRRRTLPKQRQQQTAAALQPPRHILLKERYKARRAQRPRYSQQQAEADSQQ